MMKSPAFGRSPFDSRSMPQPISAVTVITYTTAIWRRPLITRSNGGIRMTETVIRNPALAADV